jgi:alpha-beta hydrolase superfamily lysophospholipase
MWMELLGCEYRLGFANAGGLRTRYLEAGFGHREALIFLHGSGGYLEAYLRNIAAHAAHYRVFAIDMIGHGYTDKPDHPYEPAHYVQHLTAFMDAMGLERAHLSGESLGGWVAERMAMPSYWSTTASNSSLVMPGLLSTSTPRSLKMATAAGESLSAIRTLGMGNSMKEIGENENPGGCWRAGIGSISLATRL